MGAEAPEPESQSNTTAASPPSRPGGRPLARWRKGLPVIDLSSGSDLIGMVPPHQEFLLMVLLSALWNRAAEIRFEPDPTASPGPGLRLFGEVGGQLHEIPPAPQHLAAGVLEELQTIAGLTTRRRRLAGWLRRLAERLDPHASTTRTGQFRLEWGDSGLDVAATVYPSAAGDRIFLRFGEIPTILSQRSQAALRAHLDRSTTNGRSAERDPLPS